jgi:V/A-type H+-transporting ATPase subunit C
MPAAEVALIARARGLGPHLLTREKLELLAEAADLGAFVRGLSQLGAALEPIGEPAHVFAIERAVARTASRYLQTLYRWQERTPGVLDVFAAAQDRRSLRTLLRGAVQGASAEARLEGLLPTPSLLPQVLSELARQASPADVVGQLVLLGYPDALRLLPLVQKAQPDLLAIDLALLVGFADRAARAAALGDSTLREFVSVLIDLGNAQNALLLADGPRDISPADVFVRGGRWLTTSTFASAASAASAQSAFSLLARTLATSPLVPSLPGVASDAVQWDRAFLRDALGRLTRAARRDPLSTAPLLRVLLSIEAQSRDLRTLAWGAALGVPASLRKQQLVTPA